MHPNLYKALVPSWEARKGKPAHPKAIEAVSRKGAERSEAQRARDITACEKARAGITPETIQKMRETRRGQPWSPARRAAYEARYCVNKGVSK